MIGHMNIEEAQIQQKVAQTFREKRLQIEMSQAQVAKALQELGLRVHQSSYAKMETGERQISMPVAMALCTVLGVNWEDLYQEVETGEQKAQRTLERHARVLREIQARLKDEYEKSAEAAMLIWYVMITGGHTPQDDRIAGRPHPADLHDLNPEKAEALEQAWNELLSALEALYTSRLRFYRASSDLNKIAFPDADTGEVDPEEVEDGPW